MTDNAEFTFKLGIVDGHVITVEEVKQLATMPSKETIFAKLLYLINAPAQRLVTVLSAAGRDLAVVVNQAVEQGKFAGPAAPAQEVPKAEAASNAEAPKVEAPVAEAAVAAPVVEAEAPKAEAEVAAPEAVAAETVAAEAEAAGTEEDSQTAAAATEAPTEG
jgi:large subunit ribosomal protein L10